MMNPQFMPPGQNNNAPINPLGFPPSSQDVNGHQNSNNYNQVPNNGPQMMSSTKTFDPNDVSQKMQGMNINGPPSFTGAPSGQYPPGQLPPGVGFPATSSVGQGSFTPSQKPGGNNLPARPPSAQMANQLPPNSTPGTQQGSYGQMPPPMQTHNSEQNRFMPPQGPPSNQQMSQGPKQMQVPNSQPSQLMGPPGQSASISQSNFQGPPSQIPSQSQSEMMQQAIRQPGQMPPKPGPMQQHPGQMPPQPGQVQQHPGQMPPQPGQMPPQSGQMPQQSGRMPPQPGQMQQQPGQMPPQPGQMHQQPGQMPPQPGQMKQQPGQMPPQPGQMQQQPGQMPLQPGQMQQQPGQMQQQPGQMQQQPGQMPPQPGQMQQQPGQMQQQPGQMQQQPGQMQQQPGQMPLQPGQMQQQPGQMQQQPGQMQQQPGQMPPQPGQMQQQSGQMPPQPGQMPPQPGQMQQQPGQMQQQPGQMPPQPGQMQQQSGQMPLQPGQMPPHQGQMQTPQPGQLPQQPGQMPPKQPSHPGHMPPPQQPGQYPQGLPHAGQVPQQGMPPKPQMPGMPPQLSMGMSQPGFAQPGQMQGFMPPSSQGMPSQGGMPPKVGVPPQPGMNQQQPTQTHPGMPPLPGNQPHHGMPPQPGMQTSQQQQPGQLPGMPFMPPPLSQQRQYAQPPAPQQQYHAHAQGQAPVYPGTGQPQPGSGYPPQQGYPQQYGYQTPQKRLDPDQMPSPIQVMADDQANRGGIFVTNEKGLVPPLVTTDFIVDDKGNSSPRYIRSSMYSVPVTADLLKQTSMPFCLVVSPLAEPAPGESPPPLVDTGAACGAPLGPVRCSRCKAYMCPFMKFVDAGRHFKCAFCKAQTEVPMEYTQYINSMQQYGRIPPEMSLGTYEFVATKEYCRNNTFPNPPALVFIIDVSYNSIKSGLLNCICENIMNIIDALPKDPQTGEPWTRVGFITYSSTVHFYNIKGSLAQPQMLSVGDVGDMFVPLLEGFLSRPGQCGAVLSALLTLLPEHCAGNRETEIVLLPAVQAGLEALKAADTSGQLLVFHTSLPTFPAPGKLANREDRKLLATDKEKQILAPQTTEYNELGQACSAAGVSVELFVCNNSYVDCATIGQLPRLTGGQTHKFTYFTPEGDGARLAAAAGRVAARETAHDAVLRVRTSTGVRATDFYGHLYMANTTDVDLAAIDADKAIGIEIKHDDKLTAEDGVYIQVALLYTHKSGQRRLRILNLSLTVAQQLADTYRSADTDTVINFLTKQAVWSLRESTPRLVREGLTARCARCLAAYRKHCASPSSAGQLVLPEAMKLLPLYTSAVLRGDALAAGPDVTCDDRSCAMYRALTADVATSAVYTYPRLLPLHRLPELLASGHSNLPQLRASIDKMNDQGVYLLENGVHMLLWVGSQAPADFVRDVFGVASPQHIDTKVCELPELDNPLSLAARGLLEDARRRRRVPMRLTVMKQHDKLETVLRHFLVEDRGVDGSVSYVDYLCHIHKEIRALL